MSIMFNQGTHFNPVDMVCTLKDYKGKKFDLTKFVDPQTGFISMKSQNGRIKSIGVPRIVEWLDVRLEHGLRRSPAHHF